MLWRSIMHPRNVRQQEHGSSNAKQGKKLQGFTAKLKRQKPEYGIKQMAEKTLKNTSWNVQWNFSIGKRHGIEVLFKVVFVYFMYMGDLPTFMSTCITWVVGALGCQKRALDPPGTGVTDTASHHVV